MIKLYYPTKSFLADKEKGNVWYPYLLEGFKNLSNVQVILSEKMSKLSTSIRGDTISVLEVEINDKRKRVFYDWCDFMVDHKDRAKEQDAIYFKIQAYDDLLPIGQTTCKLSIFNELKNLRNLKDLKNYKYDVIGIFRTTNLERRLKAVEIVDNMNIKSLVGLQKRSPKHEFPEKYSMPKMDYLSHLLLQCQSKICLVFSGVGDSCAFSWRLPEALAMGCFIITHKHETKMPNNEYFEKNCIVTVNPDLSDLEEKIKYYLYNDKEREQIALNGQNYFDKYLTPKAMATRIINKVKDIL